MKRNKLLQSYFGSNTLHNFTFIRRVFWKHCEQAAEINITDERLVFFS